MENQLMMDELLPLPLEDAEEGGWGVDVGESDVGLEDAAGR